MRRRTFLTRGLAVGGAAAATSTYAAESTTETNKTLARRFSLEAWGTGNAALLDELLCPDFVNHNPFPGTAGNREGEKQALAMHSAAMVDPQATVEDLIAEGDKVVARYSFSATHKGKFLGIAPTGKRVKLTGINIYRIEGGKIVELWREVDVAGLLLQLGAAAPLGEKE